MKCKFLSILLLLPLYNGEVGSIDDGAIEVLSRLYDIYYIWKHLLNL